MRAGGRYGGTAVGRPPGATLLELMVVLAIIGMISGLSLVSLQALRPTVAAVTRERFRAARDSAVRTGRTVELGPDSTVTRFLPDGRGLGAEVDPVTGEWRDGR